MVVEPDAAGIDIGAEEIYVALPPDRDEESTRRFSHLVVSLQNCPTNHLKITSRFFMHLQGLRLLTVLG